MTLCYRPDTHPFNPPYPCEIIMKVISDILHDGNNMCLLNIHKIIACLYIFLIQQGLEQKH